MLVHGAQHRRRDGGDVGPHLGRLDDVADVAHRSAKHLGGEVGIGVVDRDDLGDELQAVGDGVVEAGDWKWVVAGKREVVRVDLRGGQNIKKKQQNNDIKS